MDIDDLTNDDLETLLENPEVRKTLQYDEVNLAEIRDDLTELRETAEDEDSEVYSLFTQGVADRSGRVTQQTVQKVIEGMINEVNSVMDTDVSENDNSEDSE